MHAENASPMAWAVRQPALALAFCNNRQPTTGLRHTSRVGFLPTSLTQQHLSCSAYLSPCVAPIALHSLQPPIQFQVSAMLYSRQHGRSGSRPLPWPFASPHTSMVRPLLTHLCTSTSCLRSSALISIWNLRFSREKTSSACMAKMSLNRLTCMGAWLEMHGRLDSWAHGCMWACGMTVGG